VTVSTIPSSFAITGKIQSSDVASQSGSAPLTDLMFICLWLSN